jgi:hypothetical protein
MKSNFERFCLSLLCLVLCSFPIRSVRRSLVSFDADDQEKNARILVGPNILVSHDVETAHVELMIASDPTNPKNLIGGAMTMTRREGGAACKVYFSGDGGYTWNDQSFPEQIELGGGDPQVAFGSRGTAYYLGIALGAGQDVYAYRSEDGGMTWGKGTNLGSGDHEQIVVDHSSGRFAGRVYVGMARRLPNRTPAVQVFRSEDDGRTYIGPVPAVQGRPGELGVNVNNLLLFTDDTLFVPYTTFQMQPDKVRAINKQEFFFVTSSDGGVTFSSPRRINSYEFKTWDRYVTERRNGTFVQSSFPQFAVDTVNERYRDRLYVAWADWRYGNARLLFSFSSDRGSTWTEPRPLDSTVPAESSQFQPALTVNSKGVLGIQWFDTRNSKNQDSYDVYFTASLDGGDSFLPVVKVSSASSFPASAGNLKPMPLVRVRGADQAVVANLIGPFNRWSHGGDYMGLTASADGVFHPFWTDSRSGTFQIYTTRIEVAVDAQQGTAAAPAIEEKILPRTRCSLNTKLTFTFDPVQYNMESREAIIPIRLKNISQERLYGPFQVEVKTLVQPNVYMEGRTNIPQIMNASNGKRGVGAIIDYSHALGDFESLEPGALTEAVPWKVRFTLPALTQFYFEADITGLTSKSSVK